MGNASVIRNAFARIQRKAKEGSENCLRDMMDEAMRYALDIHDDRHQRHLEIGDAYGWIITHNGRTVDYEVTAGIKASRVSALRMLRNEAKKTKTGWCGILLATLKPVTFYSFAYEEFVMSSTTSFSKRRFKELFTAYK